ncbi:MAG: hypothetical protein ABR520_11360 [Mycobacteriales bacterium]|nr:hypothetical protein [Actinomycetota bacterium]
MTDAGGLRTFAQGLIDEAERVRAEVGEAGAHVCATQAQAARLFIEEIDRLPAIDAPERIPPAIRAGLDRYADAGIRTGSFLQAVLSGDLFDAFKRADPESLLAMPAIVAYVRTQLPDVCWGSEDLVEAWIARPRS